jgi:ubiquinone/menaquinone biosynthesis C-methylase UbiE
MRLNLGSGPIAFPGWINIDRSPSVWLERVPVMKRILRRAGVLTASHMQTWSNGIECRDIRALPYRDGSVDAIYSSHTLEHLYLEDARRVVVEARRVLRPGGIIRFALPDAEKWARDLIDGVGSTDTEPGELFNHRLLAYPVAAPSTLERLRQAFGGHVHRWQPTAGMVMKILNDAGFQDVRRCSFREGNLPDVDKIETREESFFVEGFAP